MAVQVFVSGSPQSCHCIVAACSRKYRSRMAQAMNKMRSAKYQIGQVVRHRLFPFRGVVFDIDPIFNNTEEWYQSIPAEVRRCWDQPCDSLFAENGPTEYIAPM